MANFRIWAPWRLAYVKDAAKDNEEECIFCAKPAADADEENLIVHRGEHSFVILNLFPYTNGHLMVAPYAHIGRIQELPAEAVAEMMGFAQRAMDRLEDLMLELMYNLPSMRKVRECVVTREMVLDREKAAALIEKAG